jgi:predicted secreted protein
MSGSGKDWILEWDGATIGGVRTKGVAVNGEALDISDDDSAGWREVWPEAGEVSVELKLSGLIKDQRLQAQAFDPETRIHAVTLTGNDGSVIAGNFYLQSYSQGLEYKGYPTFDASLLSSGPVTFTPGS